MSAKDLVDDVKAHVSITCGGKTHKTGHAHHKSNAPDWDGEALHFTLGPDDSTASVSVVEHKTLGKDRAIGSGEVDIWRHISPAAPAADVSVDLAEGGTLRLRLEFKAGGSASALSNAASASSAALPLSPRQPSVKSRHSVSSPSPSTPSKFSLFKKDKSSNGSEDKDE